MPVIINNMHSNGGHVHYFLQSVLGGHLNSSTQGLKHHTHSEGALLNYSELLIIQCVN
jgi:hypothetical protein